MAVLKKDVRRITISVPKSFAAELETHLKKFALTSMSKFFYESALEKLAQEKIQVAEMEAEENEKNNE